MSSSHEITWSDSANRSASFNSQAAAVGIRGAAGAVRIPGAVGILDRVRRERRAETGLSRLSGLFGLSCWPDRQINQTDQTDQIDQRDERDSRSARQDLPPKPERHRGKAEAGTTCGVSELNLDLNLSRRRASARGTTSGLSVLPAWRTAQAVKPRHSGGACVSLGQVAVVTAARKDSRPLLFLPFISPPAENRNKQWTQPTPR